MLLKTFGGRIMESYLSTKKLVKYTLRMPKDYSSFFYFTLESNENLGFYSTLPFEKGQAYRDILVYTTPELSEAMDNLIAHCENNSPLESLERVVVDDEVSNDNISFERK
jgi:hypothetical protein